MFYRLHKQHLSSATIFPCPLRKCGIHSSSFSKLSYHVLLKDRGNKGSTPAAYICQHCNKHHLCNARLIPPVSVTYTGLVIMIDQVLIKPQCVTRDIFGRAAVFYFGTTTEITKCTHGTEEHFLSCNVIRISTKLVETSSKTNEKAMILHCDWHSDLAGFLIVTKSLPLQSVIRASCCGDGRYMEIRAS